MIQITEKSKGFDKNQKFDTTQIASGFQMTFSNGNTISVQFGCGNYCENRDESKTSSKNAEIAIWNSEKVWYDFGSDKVKGWCNMDEVAKWINFTATTIF